MVASGDINQSSGISISISCASVRSVLPCARVAAAVAVGAAPRALSAIYEMPWALSRDRCCCKPGRGGYRKRADEPRSCIAPRDRRRLAEAARGATGALVSAARGGMCLCSAGEGREARARADTRDAQAPATSCTSYVSAISVSVLLLDESEKERVFPGSFLGLFRR